MPNSSVFSSPSYRAKLPKTTFPMTQEIDFSSTAGTLTPVFCDFLHPGEKVSGHAEMFTRTNELQTAAFAKIDEYIEYFFVPAMKLNQIFGEWFFNVDDRPTTLRPSELPERANVLPNVTYSRLKDYCNSIASSASGAFGELTLSASLIRIMQHYRYDVFRFFDADGAVDNVGETAWNIPLVPFQAYQAIYYDYYRDTLWRNNDVEAYNTDDWLTSLTGSNISDARLAKIFQLHQRRQNSDYYTGMHPSPLQNATGMLNIDGVREAALLQLNNWLDDAGIGFSFGHAGSPRQNTNVKLGLDVTGSASISGDSSKSFGQTEDIRTQFSNSFVSERSVSGTGLIDAEIRQLDDTEYNLLGRPDQGVSNVLSHDHDIGSMDVFPNSGPISALSVALNNLKSSISSTGIRTMFALEKLAKITGRAGKHYDDQVLAHYGVKVSSAYSHEVQMIGQQHSTIEIGEVVSPTTVPDGSVAGEIVGKGYGNMTGDKVVDFTAPCHGYFMAIYSAVPRRVYTPSGMPREYSQMYRFDFMQSELMNLGQQPLFAEELNLTSPLTYPVIGWNWRYMEEKCRVPMAIGALSRFDFDSISNNGILQDWTIQYPVLNNTVGTINWESFQVLPDAFNSIFMFHFDRNLKLGKKSDASGIKGKVARLFDRDPLFHRLVMKIYKSSYMTTFGEPNID